MTTVGQGTTADQIFEWDGDKKIPIDTPGGSGGGGSDEENYPLLSIQTNDPIWPTNVGGGEGTGQAMAVFIRSTTSPIDSMACYVMQNPGGLGGITLAIYDSGGNLICSTDTNPCVDGINVFTVTTNPGVVLAPGIYYFYLAANVFGLRLGQRTDTQTPSPVPFPLFANFTNPYATDPNGTPDPLNIAGASQSFTPCPWVAAGGA